MAIHLRYCVLSHARAWTAAVGTLLTLLVVGGMSACDADLPPLDDQVVLTVPQGCNPLAFEHDCLLPYPSNFFLQPDDKTASGKRVQITPAAMLRTRRDADVDFTSTHPVDGFSHHMPILTYFSQGVSTHGVVFHTDDPSRSLLPTSKVLLIDAESGMPEAVYAT